MDEQSIVGDTSATAYLEVALTNATSPHPIAIGMADELLSKFSGNLNSIDKVSTFKMLALAWSSLRASTLMTRMGMVLQAPPVQRQALESMAYGLLFRLDEEFHKLWKQRHDDEKAASRFRREGWSRALVLIEAENERLAGGIRRQYETLIDLGAHPNVLGISQMSEYFAEPGADTGRAQYSMLLGQPHVNLAHANTGFCYSLLIECYRGTWPQLFDQFGLSSSIQRTEKAVLSLMRSIQPVDASE